MTRLTLFIGLCMALVGCPTSECPSGSMMVAGRCADTDTGSAEDTGPRADTNVDAPGLDAFAPDAGLDALVSDANCNCTDGQVCVAGGTCGCLTDENCLEDAEPFCNTETNECVACLSNGDCGGTTPFCDPTDNTCVGCTNSTQCAATMATPVCDPMLRACSICTAGEPGACTGTTPACDVSGPAPACTCTPSSCTSAVAARCNGGSNACEACTADSDCGGVAMPNNQRCINPGPSGVCRQCTVLSEAVDCPGTSCNPVTNMCSTTPVGMTTRCMPCTFDSQCEPGNTCAAVNPTLGNSGNYCLPIRVTACSALRPYAQGVDDEPTDLGGTVNYCRPRTTTCQAVLDHAGPRVQETDRCTNMAPVGISNAACGAVGVDDGLCRISGGDNYCTYSCLSGTDNDCPVGSSCVVDVLAPGGRRCSI